MTETSARTETNHLQDLPQGRSLWGDAFHRLRRDRAAVASVIVIGIYAVMAVAASFLHDDFIASKNYKLSNQPPSAQHWLGTDVFGRDVLLKTMLGAKVSMTVGLMANLIAIPLGLILGALAGYFGRRVDDVVVWLYTTLASIPGIMLLIALKYAFQGKVLFRGTPFALDLGGIHGLYIALGVVSWIHTCRVVRAETLKIKELDYVTAARALGEGHARILFFHIIPNLLHLAIILFSLGFVGAITAEVILSFLGLGVEVGTPSWGTMINAARLDLVVGRWWEVTAACTAMFFIVLALNILGDRLRDALDPKLRT
ncbi:MAG TPA: ABC transporter permease [Phycisphaerae bacterium]|nr:ABC transporter permease [Phycisphaerae bacterium]HOJ74868.1 ABC transporter permease [Phycisphaerae bacterium]HOM52031.1 ABC transporter permease [Phycisphaerae bacterium]HON64923.1 ABC transporter permease [Phycisphaerae bacterium]HOQ86208.1 ABC transporter permease [Phycisphaerae bacterium]